MKTESYLMLSPPLDADTEELFYTKNAEQDLCRLVFGLAAVMKCK